MPSPRPTPVVRFRENTDTSVVAAITRSTNMVPTTARPPTTRGRALATAPRNTNSSSTMLKGMAMNSAFLRSSCTWVVT